MFSLVLTTAPMAHTSHESYIAAAAPEVRSKLEAIQELVEALIPTATRCIGYNMPAYRDRLIFLYFAAFKNHIGVYPPVTQDEQLIQELEPYRGKKGNLSFPLAQPLPLDLIGKVAVALYREYTCK